MRVLVIAPLSFEVDQYKEASDEEYHWPNMRPLRTKAPRQGLDQGLLKSATPKVIHDIE